MTERGSLQWMYQRENEAEAAEEYLVGRRVRDTGVPPGNHSTARSEPDPEADSARKALEDPLSSVREGLRRRLARVPPAALLAAAAPSSRGPKLKKRVARIVQSLTILRRARLAPPLAALISHSLPRNIQKERKSPQSRQRQPSATKSYRPSTSQLSPRSRQARIEAMAAQGQKQIKNMREKHANKSDTFDEPPLQKVDEHFAHKLRAHALKKMASDAK